jgi:glucose-6-phosphate isomerase
MTSRSSIMFKNKSVTVHIPRVGFALDFLHIHGLNSTMEAQMDSQIDVLVQIGTGGFSYVCRAVDRETGQKCAIKFMSNKVFKSNLEQVTLEVKVTELCLFYCSLGL